MLRFGEINRPDVIINCAALTDVELCEKEPEHAFRVNALGARNLSIVARKTGAKMVQRLQMTFLTAWEKSLIQNLMIPILSPFTENQSLQEKNM